MSTYKSFSIVGFGQIGSLLVNEFLESNEDYNVRVLTRSTKKPELENLMSKGIQVVAVNYSDQQSIITALKGTDVVFSALRDDALPTQNEVIRAAKTANVKLFVPSEYGVNTLSGKYEYLKPKTEAHDLLKQLHLPYALFFTGLRPELVFKQALGPTLGIDLVAGNFHLFGNGRQAIAWTSPRSFVPFVHHVVTTLPPSKLENKAFQIRADNKSFREIITMWEKKHAQKAQVTERSPDEIQTFLTENPAPFFKFIVQMWVNNGDALISDEDNKLWPEWKRLTWEEIFEEQKV